MVKARNAAIQHHIDRQHHLSLWFLPAVAVVVSLAAGAILARVKIPDDSVLVDLVFHGDAADARQLLTVVAGTMITVTGLVFVLTVIVLQLASTQFSPRLLRTFLRDRGTQLVLATFVSTFVYSLAGLHTVGRVNDAGEAFVPRLAVSGALALALVSVGMLVYYIQHITDSTRIESIIHRVSVSTMTSLERHHDLIDTANPGPPMKTLTPHPDSLIISADRSGYVQGYSETALLRAAMDNHAIISMIHPIGHHVVVTRPLARVWSIDRDSPLDDVGRLAHAVHHSIRMEHERFEDRDVGFGIRQLVDIAIKSTAPSLNDPYTAVQTIQALSTLMVAMAQRDMSDRIVTDSGEVPRLAIPVTDFEAHLRLVCTHIRQAASNRPRVVVALMRLLEDVSANCTNDGVRNTVRSQIALLLEDSERNIAQVADLIEAQAVAKAALEILDL